MSEDFEILDNSVPEGWSQKQLKELYAIPSRNGLYKASDYYGEGHRMIHMPQMFRGLNVDLSDAIRVRVDLSELNRFGLQTGDLLFARRSLTLEGAGQCSLVLDLDEPTTFESSIIRVRLRMDEVLPEYVNYLLSSEIGYRLRLRLIRQVAVSGVSSEDIASIPIKYPPLPQQKRIARILTTVDNLIDKTEELIEKYKAIKQGMMHDLFTRGVDQNGKLRPPYEEAPELYKKTPLGWIPKEWECGPLSGFADLQVGYAFKSSWFREDSGMRLLRGENVGYGSPDWKDTKRLDESLVEQFAEYELKTGNIIIGMDRTFTKSGVKITIMHADDVPSLLVQRVGKFIETNCEADYLRVLLASPKYHADLMIQQKGMDIPHLSRTEILTPQVPIPTSNEQKTIADCLKSIDSKIATENELVVKLKVQKNGLMQDLLTGKVRVKVDEVEKELASA